MTFEECAIVEAYTGITMLTGDKCKYMYDYASRKLGRPFYTHEFLIYADALKEAAKEDFIRLCKEAKESEG